MAFLPRWCVCSDGLDSPADEGPDAVPGDGSHGHGHGLRGGQPVGVVVAGGEVADVVDVTEEEGHGAELPQAAARRACVGRAPRLTTDSPPRCRLPEPASTDTHPRSTRVEMETNTLEIKDSHPSDTSVKMEIETFEITERRK